ncbi:MAG: phosphoribosylglycinamide formyltransferase [Oscillospiraceae bacterium]|nr:phosphoribosylglycinamide formyltransferase [Oscillospiraceae bacterium]
MLKQRIAVLVSGGGTNLQALIDAQNSGTLKSGELCLVISSKPDAYALRRAQENKIPCVVANKKTAVSNAAFEHEILKALAQYEIDIIVFAGFMYILSADFVRRYPDRMINVHPSLIPSFCGEGFYGLRVHQAALEYGVKLTGATVHFVNEVTDGGKIIKQKAVAVLPGDTPETLQKRVMEEVEWVILPEALEEVCAAYAQKNGA